MQRSFEKQTIALYTMKETNEKKVILWVRVSTKEQRTGEQKEETLKLIHEDGFTDEQIEVIEGVGASAIKIDALYKKNMEKLFSLVETGEYFRVYAWSLDRIGRNEKELMFFRWKLEECGVELKTASDGVTLSHYESDEKLMFEKLMVDFRSYIAADEMRQKKKKMQRGVEESKKAGNITTHPPFGYGKIKVGRHFKAVVDEKEAEIVKRAFNLYVNENMTACAIAKKFDAEGLTTRRSKDGKIRFVWEILHREKYVGDNVFPPIIPRELFDAAQERLKESHRQPNFQYDGDLLWFGIGLLYDENGYKFGKVRRDGAYKNHSGKFHINGNIVDSLLLYVADVNQQEFQLDKVNVKETLEKRIVEKENELKGLSVEFADVVKRKSRLKSLYLRGVIDEKEMEDEASDIKATEKELKNRETFLRTTIEDLRKEIEGLRDKKKYIDIYSLSQERQHEIIKQIIKRVDVSKAKRGVFNFKFTLFLSPVYDYKDFDDKTILTIQVNPRKQEYTIISGRFPQYSKMVENIKDFYTKQDAEGKDESFSPVLDVPFIRRIPTLAENRLKQLEKYKKNKE